MIQLLLDDTPIDRHNIGGHSVHVKRDDLCVVPSSWPHTAKVRGVLPALRKMKEDGVRHVSCYEPRISKSPWVMAAVCKHLDIGCTVIVPMREEDRLPPSAVLAQRLGASTFGLRTEHWSDPIVQKGAKAAAQLIDSVLLPHGLAFQETIDAVAKEAGGLHFGYWTGSVIISVGTGTILKGLLKLIKSDPRLRPDVFGVLVGPEPSWGWQEKVTFIPPMTDYYTPEFTDCPWPCDPYYERKAFVWMLRHLNELRPPILFWNIG